MLATKPRQWQFDKKWSDRFLPEIKHILGEYLISEAPAREDAQHNTDLMVLTLNPYRIGCRVRTHSYYLNKFWREEFTIRTVRPSGAKTELEKILDGWGDFFFYGFSNEEETGLLKWTLGRLDVFRDYVEDYRDTHLGQLPGFENLNRDGSSKFRAFKITQMPDDFVVASN